MANEHWLRWHHGTVTDPKWRVIALRASSSMSRNVTVCHVLSVWASMLESASQANPRGELDGWDDEDIGAALGLDVEEVSAIREAMQGKTLDGNTLTGWKRRQVKVEDKKSADRKAAQRAREKALEDSVTNSDKSKCHDMSRDVTTEKEKEKEKEKKGQKTTPNGEIFAGVSDQIVRDFKQLRQKLRAPITETSMKGIYREASKAGISLSDALEMCCERGWRGFKADWVSGNGTTSAAPAKPRRRKQLGEGSSTNYGLPS